MQNLFLLSLGRLEHFRVFDPETPAENGHEKQGRARFPSIT